MANFGDYPPELTALYVVVSRPCCLSELSPNNKAIFVVLSFIYT